MKRNSKVMMLISGGIIGLIGALLVKFGNPQNMGICVACFIRDIAGAVGLHRAAAVQYIRPEIIGFIFGAFLTAIMSGDFKSKGGSNPVVRFVLGFFMMIGALVFLGCPLRMLLRIGGGDMNAVIGLLGFVGGIALGIFLIKKGYSLERSYNQSKIGGTMAFTVAIILLVFLLAKPMFIAFSKKGPGSMHASVIISLAAGIITGSILQKTRLCTAASFRDSILIRDFHFMYGILGIVTVNLIANIILGQFRFGFSEQPVAHSDHIWNFLGMALVGLSGVLLGGCPIRQTILSAQGDNDGFITVLGMTLGAAAAHNMNLASSAKGATNSGKIAVVLGIIIVFSIAYIITVEKNKKRKEV